jgi:glycosyltransferase involved in cell wall biosynthesis
LDESEPPSRGSAGVPPAHSDTGPPELSVLVTAHDRRTYLKGAVENLLAQSLPRPRFEVLVVKNYADTEIDDYLDRVHVEHWVTDTQPLSGKLLEAIARAHGRVLCFLEDDDRYVPDRLAVVESAFRADPKLVFFRNGFETIDAAGRPYRGWLPPAIRTSQESAVDRVCREGEKESVYRALAGALPDFNTSTMAIRRDCIEPVAADFRRIVSGVDRFLFCAAYVARGTMRFDRRRLTEYRVHGANTGIRGPGGPETLARVERLLANDRVDEQVLYELLRASDRIAARHDLEGRLLVNEIYGWLGGPPTDRRRVAGLLRRLPGYRDTQSVRANRRLGLEAFAYLVTPAGARRIHRRRLAGSAERGP